MEGICSICNQWKKVHKNRKIGILICKYCYLRNFNLGKCSYCRKVKPIMVKYRTTEGKSICRYCFLRMKLRQCAECGKIKIIAALDRCYACYQRQRRTKITSNPA